MYLAFQCLKGVDEHPIRIVQVGELAQFHGHVSGIALRKLNETREGARIQGRKTRKTQGEVFRLNRELKETMMNATEYVADGG